ncbi:SufE family protein [Litorivicinus sp.]|jgi:cysteine desulfuration protein SufE|nr:SufE family protein [Litorivicinus sp.]|tara:strand:- start:5501 stop:5923 length:423 start_codon:yes stop_codon:yes gene_type:complete
MQLSERQQEIIDEFHFFESWMDKYQYLIDLGKELAPLNPSEMNDANLVRGCQSNVWMLTEGDADNMIIRATSDAAIVSGLIALVIRLYSGASAQEIVQTKPDFIGAIGLSQHLSPTRANGLASMLTRVKSEAIKKVAANQ